MTPCAFFLEEACKFPKDASSYCIRCLMAKLIVEFKRLRVTGIQP